jgi:hypothetical protein
MEGHLGYPRNRLKGIGMCESVRFKSYIYIYIYFLSWLATSFFYFYFNQHVNHVSIFHPSLNGNDQFDTRMKG